MKKARARGVDMSERERALMLRVLDGYPDLAPVVYHLWHYRRCEEMLQYLVANNLTGQKLWQFMKQEAGKTPMNLAKELLKRLENQRQIGAVLVGRDFIA